MPAGLISAVAPGSLAERVGLQLGDELVSINGHLLRDVIDVRFYSAEEHLALKVRREEEFTVEAERRYGEPLGLEVLHATEWLAGLIDQGRMELHGFPQPVTYHDPCDLGRTSGIYDAPRKVIEAIPGIQFTEMAENRELSLCCGGGGDAEMADAELTAVVGKRRIEQVQETGAKVVISACQQCNRTLAEAARKNRIRIRAMDITEVVWQAMQENDED